MFNVKQINRITFALLFLSIAFTSAASKSHQSHYAGQEGRKIKSLSSKDIQDLQSGAGWGLAKPAELNGVPGPIHVLELTQDLGLSKEQVEQIEAIWSKMNQKAIDEGNRYIAAEQKIENFFASQSENINQLEDLLNQSSQHLANLRKIHLSAHLETLPVLSLHQIKKYNVLRGYQDHTHHHHH